MFFKLITLGSLKVVLCVVLFRAFFIYKPQSSPKACIYSPGHQRIKLTQGVLNRFIGALNIPTVSYKAHDYEPEQLLKMIDYIEQSFPAIHGSAFVKREIVSNYTLLYTIEGSNKRLRPYMLTSHMDVVPANRRFWSSDPFNATVKEDNHIYARGTIDAKHLMVSMLEALEFMLSKGGFKPQRSFYLVFGHDEEVGGLEGAQTISKMLETRLRESKWDKLEYILDEGTIISKSRFPGLEADVGLVSVVEKGMVTIRLSVNGSVGHGSMPPPQTAIARLSASVSKFHNKLFPSFMGLGPEKEMIEIFAAHAKWPYKLVYSNFWLFKPVLEYIFSSDSTLNSFIRTSTAVTVIRGGTKENVLPDSAEALVNHRIHQQQSASDVLKFDRAIVDDPVVQVEIHGYHSEPSPVSPYCDNCYGFQLVKQSLLQIYPGTIVVPSVFLAASDSRWYTNLSDSIYKMSAIAVHLEEMKRFHGHDERISLENYENLINFYHHLIQNSDAERMRFRPEQRDEL